MAINILFNFVMFIFKSGSIQTFINLFKAVFDSVKDCNRLDICVAVKFGQNVRVIWHDPTIIYLDASDSRHSDRKRYSIIRTGIALGKAKLI